MREHNENSHQSKAHDWELPNVAPVSYVKRQKPSAKMIEYMVVGCFAGLTIFLLTYLVGRVSPSQMKATNTGIGQSSKSGKGKSQSQAEAELIYGQLKTEFSPKLSISNPTSATDTTTESTAVTVSQDRSTEQLDQNAQFKAVIDEATKVVGDAIEIQKQRVADLEEKKEASQKAFEIRKKEIEEEIRKKKLKEAKRR